MDYAFTFSSIAKTTQVRLLKGADIEHLEELNQMYWLVLSCATTAMGPEGEATARALDADKDGRVRIPEVLSAVAWLKPRLASFDVLFQPAEGLRIEEIHASTEEGVLLKRLLTKLAPDGYLTPAAMGTAFDAFRASDANGDGAIPPTAVAANLQPIGEAMLAVTGDAAITMETLDTFDTALKAYREWQAAEPSDRYPIAAIRNQKAKIDAFFLNCDLLRYNPAAMEAMPSPKSIDALAEGPIALPSGALRALPFAEGINPVCLADMAVIETLAKSIDAEAEALTPELWEAVQRKVADFGVWFDAKPASADGFMGMDAEGLTLASAPETRRAFEQAIEADLAQAPLAAAFDDLQRLVTLRLGFLRFLQNFVNVEGLYPPSPRALFQTGTLYLDGRACSLCFPIEQAAAAHAAAANNSNCCLVYCALSRPLEGAKRTICAVFTAGTAETLAVGRNGIFVDLEGKDWEATVVQLKPNPMGMLEAFLAPWRKVADAFAEGVRKLIASKGDTATASMVTKASSATSGTSAAPQASNGAMMASVATLGIALSFVATALTGILAALTHTPIWRIALAVLGIVLIVSVPNMILTWFRLRSRDLAPILNASGWAVNRRIGLTPMLGRFFTQRANYIGRRFTPAPVMTQTHSKLKWGLLCLLAVILVLASGWYFFCPTSPRNKRSAVPAETTEVTVEASVSVPETAEEQTEALVAPAEELMQN